MACKNDLILTETVQILQLIRLRPDKKIFDEPASRPASQSVGEGLDFEMLEMIRFLFVGKQDKTTWWRVGLGLAWLGQIYNE